MKVLLVADAVGGVFTHAVELARALRSRDVRVVLATEGAELTAERKAAIDALDGVAHEGRAFRLEWMEEPWDDVAAAGRWLLALEARERPDVVHTCELAHGALPFRAPKLVVGHSCVLSWFEAVRGAPAPATWDRYREAVGAGLRGADAVAAPSAWMARALVRHHAPLPPPRVVANGRDPARFVPRRKRDLVLGAGRVWDEAKNAAALVRVAPRLPWPVFVAGEAAPPAGVARGAGPGLPPRPGGAGRPAATATFLGRLSEADLARWLGEAAIFAHPARYEPFGLAVLEAALAGCALVLGDIESLRDTWDGAAEFAASGDDDALASAIERLARDRVRRAGLAERARARALGFTPARMAEGYVSIYDGLARRGTGGGP